MMITSSIPTVVELLNRMSLWEKHAEGFKVLYVGEDNRSANILVKTEELAQRHPDLPRILNHWCERHSFGKTNASTSQTLLVNTLRNWENPLTLTDSEGEVFRLAHIDNVRDPGDEEVVLEATMCEIADADGIAYVGSTRDVTVVIEAEKLNSLFPGWRERLSVFQSLDMEDDELDSFVFTKTPALNLRAAPLPEGLS